jgi:glycosyltransferase involved in cell wall biosynthesis
MCISKQTYNIVKQVLKNTKHEDWQITYVPHGINQNNFYPIDETHPEWNELQNFRKELVGDEIDFITFYNARNIRRKHTSDLILGFKEFCDTLPKEKADKCLLLMHTEQIDDNGTDLPAVINELCPYKVKFTSNRIITTKELNYLYNISDVTANIASNEGFGLGTAESVMAGTPIVVNVTGGMQDQCGFKDDSGKYLTEYDYNDDFQTNAVKRYTSHGEWAEPVFPAVRTLQGSPPTPYIFDDIADFRDCAVAIKTWYDRDYAERKRRGKVGREWMLSKETGLSAESMGERFVKDMNTAFTNWTSRVKVELIKI